MQVSAMTEEKNTQKLLAMTARLVAAYVGNNSVPAAQLPEIIRGIYASLSGTQ
ncbi:MAG: MucR family transcriptional regulator, partial [Rhodospirillales bacterium]|nr:MucR family transcriptional regulator [Rhodospirillales bacterium]